MALVLSSAIGLERELRQKAAGLRTYTLVGLGSALYEDGRGILRRILAACTSRDFKVADVNVNRPEGGPQRDVRLSPHRC